MGNLFSQVLNMSVTGSIVILLVILARCLLRRSPKIFSYALWSVVLFRLLCPVAFTGTVSVLEAFQPEVKEASDATSIVSYLPAERDRGEALPVVSGETLSETAPRQTEPAGQWDLMVPFLWAAGAAAMVLYSAVLYIRLRRKLVGAMVYRGNVYLADYLDTPFVMGIFRPRIYLPSNLPKAERKYIIAHERHHIRRFDHIFKLLAYLALCLHWFNPLVWAAFILAGKDMEMSCDEAVIRRMGSQIRAEYSESLLRLATHKKIIAGMPLAFGEGDTKGRVRNMEKWKKPKLWVRIVCFALCAAVLAACAVNPETLGETEDPNPQSTTAPDNASTAPDSTLMDGPVSAGLGDFHFTVPEGMSMQSVKIAHSGNAWDDGYAFFAEDTAVGGLALRYPDPSTSLEVFSRAWQAELGVPEAADDTFGYMGGSSNYADYEVTYFPDMPTNLDANGNIVRDETGTYVLENEVTHYFFRSGTDVYDLWFYIKRVPTTTQEALLKSCYIEGVTDMVSMEAAQDQEIEALEKCRAVLDAVQSGSCHILVEQSSSGDSASRWSTANYYQDGEDWLKIEDVDPESVNIVDGEQYSRRMAFMAVNGVRYSNDGNWGKAYSDIQWKEDSQTFSDEVKPWLASFQWKDTVAYIDTLPDENGERVMLRVDEKYGDSDEYDPHYFVNFYFDSSGSFVSVQLLINLFRENELGITESIVSMDSETVNTEIQQAYQQAAG